MIVGRSVLSGALLTSLCVALIAVGCHRHAGTSPFPASNEVTGWARTGEIRTFPAPDLWKYIDGDAERYLKAGVRAVSTADYRFSHRVDAVVDVYTMDSAGGGDKILKSEPASNAKIIQLGEEARLYNGSLVFRKGPYLVRITAYESSNDVQQALLALGRNIDQRLAE